MKTQDSSNIFDQKRASSHDIKREKLAPMRDALHLFIRMALSELPDNANILCVGVGTGSELIYLAQSFPNWTFTAVEPASAMLEICKKRTIESSIVERCTFHEGYLDSLPKSTAFHAATSILVSQFIMNIEDRKKFFKEISERLRSDGILVTADLASDTSSTVYRNLFDIWVRTMKFSDIPDDEIENLRQNISILPQYEIESIFTSSGFDTPVLFFQTLLIHAWFCKLKS